mgnify:CR=1 FL=1
MESRTVTTPGGDVQVRIGGPESRYTVLLFPDAGEDAGVYDVVCERLHTSDLRTIVVEKIDGLAPADVFALLDALALPWVHLAGSGAGVRCRRQTSVWRKPRRLLARSVGRRKSLPADRPLAAG